MKKPFLRIAVSCIIAVISFSFISADNPALNSSQNNSITFAKTWTEFVSHEGIEVEYKFEVCDNESVKNQVLALFKFTNTTTNTINFSWTTKIYRNNSCTNCHRLDNPEYSHSLTLAPGEVIEGTNDSKENKALYLFSNFIELSPGMTTNKLTNFEFINLESVIVQ